MNYEFIIKLARDAGLGEVADRHDELIRFAALVRAAALEEAAEEADRWQTALHDQRYECDCATAIRALKGANMNKMINDGNPAFPVWELNGHGQPSMTIRDYFAAHALQGLLTNNFNIDCVVELAWRIADAMLKAREASND